MEKAVTEWEDQKAWLKNDRLATINTGPEPHQYWFMDTEDAEDILIQPRSSSTPIALTTQSQMHKKRAESKYRDDSGGSGEMRIACAMIEVPWSFLFCFLLVL